MSSIEAWLIIILVLGVIASNIAVLKYSAKFKMPQFGKPEDKPTSKNNSEKLSDNVKDETASEDKPAKASNQTTVPATAIVSDSEKVDKVHNQENKKSDLL
jgi:hypothetical protein